MNMPLKLALPARALIADDERLMREQLRSRLGEVWPELAIVAEAKNGIEAVQMTAAQRPDVVFLDIRMPGMSGVDAAREIAKMSHGADPSDAWHGSEVVFITAYDQHAVEAFEQGAIDYVLKPAERERLQLTVERIQRRLQMRQAGLGVALGDARHGSGVDPSLALERWLQDLADRIDRPTVSRLRWIQATVGSSIQMLPVEEVLFFISDEKYTRVQTVHLEALIRKPIKELIGELDPAVFWQIHRSTLVNTKFIAAVGRDGRGRQIVTLKGHPQRLEVSRGFAGLFKGM